MMRHPNELRAELTLSTPFGNSPVESVIDLVERRGGRIIPTPDISRIERNRLMRLSRYLARHAATPALYEPPVPTPKQLQRITFDTEMGCWKLPTYQDQKGRARYGNMHVNGIDAPSGLAHRAMYQVFFGIDSLSGGHIDFLDHICEDKSCCYPRHLEKVTPGENTRRGKIRDHGIEPLF